MEFTNRETWTLIHGRPIGSTPEEIENLLAAVPDLRPALAAASSQEVAELLMTTRRCVLSRDSVASVTPD